MEWMDLPSRGLGIKTPKHLDIFEIFDIFDIFKRQDSITSGFFLLFLAFSASPLSAPSAVYWKRCCTPYNAFPCSQTLRLLGFDMLQVAFLISQSRLQRACFTVPF
jgi:hypothetical protein